MQRTALRAAALAVALACVVVSPSHASIVLNEVVVNPPGADDAREYVEVRATQPGESFAGVWLLELEGDATGPGVIENAVDLSAVVPGANGIVLLGHNYATTVPWPGVPSDTVRVNLARRGSSMMENGSATLLLVRHFSGAFGNDLDVNDDGILDGAPWSEVLDGVGWTDAAGGRVYSAAVVLLTGGVIDAVSRLPDSVGSSSGAAWYGGDLAPSGATPDLSTAYDAAHVTATFPTPPAYDGVGALTPGRPNVPHLATHAECGDGTTDAGEQCDDGNLLDGDCCSGECELESADTVCRAAAGDCDVAERCTGASSVCPAEGYASAETPCRAAAGDCDVAEHCTGTSSVCPADAYVSAETSCRAAAGDCDVAEHCTGASAACPEDGYAPAETSCRAAAGDCDVAEHCTGMSAACPADAFVSAETSCRAAAGGCDVAEHCTGTTAACPGDAYVSAETSCRSAAGDCDVAEHCTGTSAACPADAFVSAETSCRAAAGDCDVAEHCTGTGPTCPADAPAPDDSPCDDADACTSTDRCTSGACAGDADPSCAPPSPSPLLCRKVAAAKAPRGAPAYPVFAPRTGDVVVDALATSAPEDRRQLDLSKPATVCTHANVAVPGAHLEAFQAKITKLKPSQPKPPKSVHTVANDLGTLRVRIDGVDRVLAPASLATGDDGAPPPPAIGDAFKCYKVSVAREAGNAFEPARVTVRDALAGDRVLDLVKPSLLCNPADVNGSDPTAPARLLHQVCYAAKLAKLDPAQAKPVKTRVSLATGFGAQVLDVGALAEVCLPSQRLD